MTAATNHPIKVALSHNRPGKHCGQTIQAGTTVLQHCRLCSWWTCPACHASNSRTGHTHPDHGQKLCPGGKVK